MKADQPLTGLRILNTKAKSSAQSLSNELKANGAIAIDIPLIHVGPPDSWQDFDNEFRCVEKYEWIIFASSNAVESTMSRCSELGLSEKLKTLKLACVGSSTASCLEEYGLSANLVPANFIAESLVEAFPLPTSENKNKVLWPRTNIGRKFLKEALEEKGWQVTIVNAYKTSGPEDSHSAAKELKQLLENKQLDVITISSSETARQLYEVLLLATDQNTEALSVLIAPIKFAVIGPETAKTCMSLFGRVDIQARESSAQGLSNAIATHFSSST